jgi:nitroreductase
MGNHDSQMALRYHRETSHSLQSLRSNTWRLDWSNRPIPYKIYSSLEPLPRGDFRHAASHLALDQDLGGDAAVNIYFMADLEPILERFGNRGYRAAQLEAAIVAGKLYLAAYALHSGATGLTFFDDEVTAFFSPHAAGKSVMFLMSLGQPLKKRKQ